MRAAVRKDDVGSAKVPEPVVEESCEECWMFKDGGEGEEACISVPGLASTEGDL